LLPAVWVCVPRSCSAGSPSAAVSSNWKQLEVSTTRLPPSTSSPSSSKKGGWKSAAIDAKALAVRHQSRTVSSAVAVGFFVAAAASPGANCYETHRKASAALRRLCLHKSEPSNFVRLQLWSKTFRCRDQLCVPAPIPLLYQELHHQVRLLCLRSFLAQSPDSWSGIPRFTA